MSKKSALGRGFFNSWSTELLVLGSQRSRHDGARFRSGDTAKTSYLRKIWYETYLVFGACRACRKLVGRINHSSLKRHCDVTRL